MKNYLPIVRAVYGGLSQRKAAATFQVSRNTVALLLVHAKSQGWFFSEDLADVDEARFREGLAMANSPSRDTSYKMPDYEEVHTELAKPHVTLKLLWEEYVEQCQQEGVPYYMETQFRRYYHQFANVHKATIRLEHKPALSMEVDWAGTKIVYFDEEEGSAEQASLFVGVLPCSQLMYAEPFRDEKQAAWIAGHVNAFDYFGGVPKSLIPDNLKTGVKQANFYDPGLNKTYLEMAIYYGTVVLPARVGKPRDTSSAEKSVQIASRRIIAKLRNVQMLSFRDLQENVRNALEEINAAPLTGKSESRWTGYIAEEKAYMLSLPPAPYELAEWSTAKVQPNCHVQFNHRFYSVPFEYLGYRVDVRATRSTIELFYHHQRIASHKRIWGKRKYSTIKEHMPPDKLFFVDWDKDRFLNWAGKIGPSTNKVVKAIIERAVIEQQAYRSCFGVMKLAEKYTDLRLERACSFILQHTESPSYRQVKHTLEKDLDLPAEQDQNNLEENRQKRTHLRGASYFGGNNNVGQ